MTLPSRMARRVSLPASIGTTQPAGTQVEKDAVIGSPSSIVSVTGW